MVISRRECLNCSGCTLTGEYSLLLQELSGAQSTAELLLGQAAMFCGVFTTSQAIHLKNKFPERLIKERWKSGCFVVFGERGTAHNGRDDAV